MQPPGTAGSQVLVADIYVAGTSGVQALPAPIVKGKIELQVLPVQVLLLSEQTHEQEDEFSEAPPAVHVEGESEQLQQALSLLS